MRDIGFVSEQIDFIDTCEDAELFALYSQVYAEVIARGLQDKFFRINNNPEMRDMIEHLISIKSKTRGKNEMER